LKKTAIIPTNVEIAANKTVVSKVMGIKAGADKNGFPPTTML